MIIFILGIIIGLIIGIVIVLTLTFFRSGIEKRVKIIETRVENAGPKPKGAIYIPESENEEFRKDFVKNRSAKGQRTTLSELQDEN